MAQPPPFVGGQYPPPGYPPHGYPPPRRSVVPLVLAAVVLTVLLAGAITFAALQFADSPRRPEAAPPAPSSAPQPSGTPEWMPYVDAGKAFAVLLTSVSSATIDADVEKILAASTGAFHDDFQKRSEEFKRITRDSQVSTTASVQGAGLEKLSADSAQVLVATNTTTSRPGSTDEAPRHWRLRLTIEKLGAEFKTSNVEFVP